MSEDKPLIFWILFMALFTILLGFGIYTDHQYKMKKLELVESGKLKTCWELYEKK